MLNLINLHNSHLEPGMYNETPSDVSTSTVGNVPACMVEFSCVGHENLLVLDPQSHPDSVMARVVVRTNG